MMYKRSLDYRWHVKATHLKQQSSYTAYPKKCGQSVAQVFSRKKPDDGLKEILQFTCSF